MVEIERRAAARTTEQRFYVQQEFNSLHDESVLRCRLAALRPAFQQFEQRRLSADQLFTKLAVPHVCATCDILTCPVTRDSQHTRASRAQQVRVQPYGSIQPHRLIRTFTNDGV
ncbi:hypothetical protein [Afipia sp. P52-10]|uniref:hypothetical protein n=1 Tax=Afipia sp. P52-10 TaxID=1429916 RepID=UPI0015643871|nr:hypothetical protein [Afipia sp. P52-10]